MKLLIGLGNPGQEYENTRHNIGFMVLDEVAKNLNLKFNKEKFKGLFCEKTINGEKIILFKPLTYMNLSGDAVRNIVDYYKLDLDDIIVIHDDLDLPTGKLKIKHGGSSGGHKGVESIIKNLNSEDFKRLKIGISKTVKNNTKDYVLEKFSKKETEYIKKAVKDAAVAIYEFINGKAIELIMNKYN